jgi:hypothetical protein
MSQARANCLNNDQGEFEGINADRFAVFVSAMIRFVRGDCRSGSSPGRREIIFGSGNSST